jgi:hypothetical protein
LFSVFTAPVRTFRSLGDHPPILPPYVAAMVAGLLVVIAVVQVLPSTLASRGMAGAPASAVAIGAAFVAVPLLLGPWGVGAFDAWIAGQVGRSLGGGVPFAAYFGMIGYARLPVFVGSLLTAVTSIWVKEFPSSLAFLVPKGSSTLLWALLNSLRPFDVWYYCLLAVGFSTLHKTRLSRAVWFPLTLYGLSLTFEVLKVITRGVPGW